MSEAAEPASIDPMGSPEPDATVVVDTTEKKAPDSEEPGASTKENPDYANTKHRIKDGNNEIEINYEDLISGYQKASASDKRFREAAGIRKQVDDLLGKLKSGDHKDLVKILGKDTARKVAQDLMVEEIEYEQLPDHEKTIRQLEAEKRQAEEKLAKQETERQTQQRQILEEQAAVKIEDEMLGALKESNLNRSPRLIARMAEIMEAGYRSTGQKIPAAKALEYVREELSKDFHSYLSGLNKEQVLALKKELPKEFLDVLRKDDVEAVLSQDPMKYGDQGRSVEKDPSSKKRKANNRRMTTDAWFEKMEQRLGG